MTLNNFSFACCHQYVFFKKLAIQVFCLSFFFQLNCMSYFCIWLSLFGPVNSKHFLPFCRLSFVSGFHHCAKALKFNWVPFVYFCFFPLSLQLLFSHSVVSDSLRPLGLQHARLPCPSPSPRVCSSSFSTELVMPSNHLILCRPLLLLPSIFPNIRVLQ